MVGVPGVAWFDRLITSVGRLAAQQPIMLDVVGLRQPVPADKMMGKNERSHSPSECGNQRRGNRKRQRKTLQDFILDRPDGFAAPREPLGFVAPAARKGSRQLSRGEAVD